MPHSNEPSFPKKRPDNLRFPPELVYQAARMYYLDEATQVEIASRLDVSRPTVSRLVAEARRLGLVRIQIVDPFSDDNEGLAEALRDALGVRSVHLAAVTHPSTLGRDLAAPVSAAIQEMQLVAGDALLISLGRTVHDLARSGLLPPLPGMVLVPAVGGQTEPESWFQSNEITRMAAESTRARAVFLFAQTLPSPEMRASLEVDAAFRGVMDLWNGAKGALLGIGAPTATRQVLSSALPEDKGLFDEAAGDVCLNFFRSDGSPLEFPGSDRMVRTSRETLAALPWAVGVAVGPEKTASIIGAVRARLINALVTDASTARALLAAL